MNFYWTCYHQAYRAVKHTEVNLLNFREYYSTDLMEEIKADINYDGEYAAGYGLNTAVLEYSGFPRWTAISVFTHRAIRKNLRS